MKRERGLTGRLVWVMAATGGLLACGVLVWTSFGRAGELLSDRRAQVESLAPAEKEALLEHFKRFEGLKSSERARLRQLNEEIEAAEDGPKLRGVMVRYYDWLKTLPPGQQAELADMPATKRVARIKKLLEEQAKRIPRRPAGGDTARREPRRGGFRLDGSRASSWLSPADLDAMLKWFEAYAGKQRAGFLKELPESKRREWEQAAGGADPVRPNEILATMWLWWQLNRPGKMPLSEEDLADLRSKLSPDARRRLESRPADVQWRMISGIIPLYVLRQYGAKGGGRGQIASEEELAEFFEKELSPQQRDRLLSLPGDEVHRELWRTYVRWKLAKLAPPPGRREGRTPQPAAPKPNTGKPERASDQPSLEAPAPAGHQ